MVDRGQVREGMSVYGSDGKKVGRVVNCRDGDFVVEKGFFFPTDYMAHYEEIAQVSTGEVKLSCPGSKMTHTVSAVVREGGLGESVSLVMAGAMVPPEPLGRDAFDERETLRDVEPSARYGVGESARRDAPTYGDEGGGGLL